MIENPRRLEAQATAVHDQHIAFALSIPSGKLVELLQEAIDHARLHPDGPVRVLGQIAVIELAYAVGVALLEREADPV